MIKNGLIIKLLNNKNLVIHASKDGLALEC